MPVRPLPPELAEQARDELNEDPRRLEEGIQHLREWIAKQSYLRARSDDQWLATFLRGCKYSIERTKEKIDLYYSLRTTAPDLFSLKYDDPKFMDLLRSGVALVLPKSVGLKGPRVVLIRANQYDPAIYNVNELLALTLVLQQILYIEDDSFVISGAINIVDLEGATMAHFLQMTPAQIKKLVICGQDASPARLRSSHYISPPHGFETVLCIGKKILSDKIKDRIYVHRNIEELYEFVPKEILPFELGGEGGTTQEIVDYWEQKIKLYGPWLQEDQQFGTDEQFRPGQPKTAADMFGVDGSFRQLDFD
ncbi:hypothetical protein ACJJTC_012168 [Scirpophaga incertulas]